uniref:Sec-independent protein translocase protein TatA n=1 Tax=Rhodosorus marinus TaxID=101924 RepID=A0A7S0BK48_9RHOD
MAFVGGFMTGYGRVVASSVSCGSSRSVFLAGNVPALKPNPRVRPATVPCMGLFGLGFPELLVIGGVTALIFGPNKISELGKSLGSVAGSVKKATSEFQDAMQESLEQADKEIAAQKESDSGKEGETKKTPTPEATTIETKKETKKEES